MGGMIYSEALRHNAWSMSIEAETDALETLREGAGYYVWEVDSLFTWTATPDRPHRDAVLHLHHHTPGAGRGPAGFRSRCETCNPSVRGTESGDTP